MTKLRPRRFTFEGVNADLYRADAAKLVGKLPAETFDLILTSPPYCMGMPYESSVSAADFMRLHRRMLPQMERLLKPGGSLCWQVGHHVSDNGLIPLDALVYQAASERTSLKLRNRVIWHFGHGRHNQRRFSGRHETVLWFTKGDDYLFDLDAVRIPQKYPGKRAYKGAKKGQLSGNPLGKNPGDVWEIPNVNARHPEKTDHPCQFPIALAQRLIKSLTKVGGTVFDPFMGSGTSAVAALMEGRNFIGSDLKEDYLNIAEARLCSLSDGTLRRRPDVPPREPRATEAVSQLPEAFAQARGWM